MTETVSVETVEPTSETDLAEILAAASAAGRRVAVVGGGTHREMGHDFEPDLVISTAAFNGIEAWEPDDLTLVVGSGTPVATLETELAAGRQTAMLPEQAGAASVGGVVATGASGYRRLRYGPTRDRLLEVRAVTGDGRVIRGGGRVVKNVSGYDLPRLYAGSFGSLGVITSVCFKLWPLSQAVATVPVEDVSAAAKVHRPLAVLQTPGGVFVHVAGTAPEVEDQVRRLGGHASDHLVFPDLPRGDSVWSARVPPSLLGDTIDRLPPGADFVAQHGVGEMSVGLSVDEVVDLRSWIEARGGRLVRLRGAADVDPWGTPPPGLDLQRRLVAAFDPARILEPGRLPGRI